MDPNSIKDVEAVLAAFPGVAAVAVAGQEAKPAGQCLVGYVAPDDVDMQALHVHARKLLPGHLVPAAIVALRVLPTTADGTPDKRALPAPNLDRLAAYRAPATARQKALCEIFAEVLRLPRLGADDDFFNLGGRSVDAMLMATRVSDLLGIRMSIADLFDAPTVGELDLRLDRAADPSFHR
jgi:Phosphopantetheine attachment site/AMP-binding enzyme C-terminal domain